MELLAAGARVEVRGLENNTDLNGKRGVVVVFGMGAAGTLVLKLLGLNHQAFDEAGVTRAERERRRAEYNAVLKAGLITP